MTVKHVVLLNGPQIDNKKGEYGSGMGGFVRNMQVYVDKFQSDRFVLKPCFNSIREARRWPWLSFSWRYLTDVLRTIRLTSGVSIVHILGQYGNAIAREYTIVLWCKIRKIRVVYEMKGGAFVSWYESANPLLRKLALLVLTRSDAVLCEGRPYVDYLKKLQIQGSYFPNFVPDEEVAPIWEERLNERSLRILFVGYCYEDKGVFDLVRACEQAARAGVPIELTLVGHENPRFANWMDNAGGVDGIPLKIRRMGLLCHSRTIEVFRSHDIFCMPTRHPGEGHTNSINEALAAGLVVVCTRHGFLPDILTDESAYFVEKGNVAELANIFLQIDADRVCARLKAKNGRSVLMLNFTSRKSFKELEEHYSRILAAATKSPKAL